jgi:hypothetical protein
MSELAQPPNPGRELLNQSEPLKQYHGTMSSWFDQVAAAVGALSLKENFGATLSDALTVTAGAGGALGQQAFVPLQFSPFLVLYVAEQLDAAKKPTGLFTCGGASWTAGTRSEEGEGIYITTASQLSNGTTYSLTAICLP